MRRCANGCDAPSATPRPFCTECCKKIDVAFEATFAVQKRKGVRGERREK